MSGRSVAPCGRSKVSAALPPRKFKVSPLLRLERAERPMDAVEPLRGG